MENPTLNLNSLSTQFRPGITSVIGAQLEEAAAVCFENEGHNSPVRLLVNYTTDGAYNTIFKDVTNQMRKSWNDKPEATEYGAMGVAVLVIEVFTDSTVILRSAKGTGFDYLLGKKKNLEESFEETARLEVSGILRNSTLMESRLKRKMNQTKRSDGELPAYIAVVEFSTPKVKVIKR